MPIDHQSQSLSSASTDHIPPYWTPPQDKGDHGNNFHYLSGLRLKPQQPPNGKCTIVEEAEQVRVMTYPDCNCVDKKVKANGTIEQLIIDEPRGFRRVYIKLRRQRYKCKCGMTMLQPLVCVVETRCLTQPGRKTPQGRKTKRLLITQRLLEYIQIESLLQPDLAVAKATGVSVRIVRAIRNDFTAKLEKEVKFETPRVLGIDGVRINGKLCIILTDIEAGLVIGVLKGADKKIIVEWLEALPDRDKIKLVLMDMCITERAAIQTILPHCTIIVDRFHIQRMANELMDRVRLRFYKSPKKDREPGEKKRPRPEPFRMCRSKLEGRMKYLEVWFKVQPELEIAYNLKEDFLEIWDDESPDVTSGTGRSASARKCYEQWEEKIPQGDEYKALRADCGKILCAVKNWGTYIFNYFDYPFTNAFTESANRQIKDNNRELRGCSFETARARIIYGTYLRKQREEFYQQDEAQFRPRLHKNRRQKVDTVIMRARREALARLEQAGGNEPEGSIQANFTFLN